MAEMSERSDFALGASAPSYERALDREAALGAPCAVHGSEAGLARALEARGAPGDRDRARGLWTSAEQGFERLGVRLPERHRRPIPTAE